MIQTILIAFSGVLAISVAQRVTINIVPAGAIVVEGNNLTITCTDGRNPGTALRLRENGAELTGNSVPPNEVSGVTRTFYLPVNRTRNGEKYDCFSGLLQNSSDSITLTVAWNDPISVSVSNDSVLGFTVFITLNANPTPMITIERVDGRPIPDEDARVTIVNDTIVFRNLTDGTYILTASNAAGNQTATFFLPAGAVVVIVNAGTLTVGQIAGIAVGSVAFIVLAAILIVVMIVVIKKVRDRNLNK